MPGPQFPKIPEDVRGRLGKLPGAENGCLHVWVQRDIKSLLSLTTSRIRKATTQALAHGRMFFPASTVRS